MMLLISTLCVLSTLAFASEKITQHYVDYYPGDADSNVIMTAPHDGHLKFAEIPTRKRGCYNETDGTCDWHHDCGVRRQDKCLAITWADRDSSLLALRMREVMGEVLGKMPHLIISRMHRSQLDPNRFRDNAAQYNPIAEQTYDTFHGYIEQVHKEISALGPGIHFDIHGYTSHNIDNWLELGYNLRGSQLNSGDLNTQDSSLKALAARSDKSFASLISGADSLGRLVQEEGYRVVPSPQYPRPELGVQGKYFRGGYITRKWGSLYGGNIDCVQLEVPQWVRDKSELHGEKLGRAFAAWVQHHYPN